MTDLPGIHHTVRVLTQLRDATRDLARREQELDHERQTHSDRLAQRDRAATTRRQQDLAQALQQVEADCAAERLRLEDRHQQRQLRIDRARQAALRHRLQQVEDEEGRHTFAIQRDALETTRLQESQLKAAEAAFEQYANHLAQQQETLAILEHRAAAVLQGYPRLLRHLRSSDPQIEVSLNPDPERQLEDGRQLLDAAGQSLVALRRTFFPLLFGLFPRWLLVGLILLIHAGWFWLAPHLSIPTVDFGTAGLSTLAALAAVALLHAIGHRLAAPRVRVLAARLAQVRNLNAASAAVARQRYENDLHAIRDSHDRRTRTLDQAWERNTATATTSRESWQHRLDEQRLRARASNDRLLRQALARHELECCQRLDALRAAADTQAAQWSLAHQAELARFNDTQQSARQTLRADAQRLLPPLISHLESARTAANTWFPPWPAALHPNPPPPTESPPAVRFGILQLNLPTFLGSLPRDPELFPGTSRSLEIPLLLSFPEPGALLLETDTRARPAAIEALNAIILRLLAVSPPGRLDFTILDPVALGQHFAGLMHLADYDEHLINSRIWTQSTHLEERLADLNGHVEKVTQMYLRNEFPDIAAYNRQAGRMAEKYRFLVIADFPAGFSDLALRRLSSLLTSGPRCGVFPLIHWNLDQPAPADLDPGSLHQTAVRLHHDGQRFLLDPLPPDGAAITLESPPDPAATINFLNRVGRSSLDAGTVQVPFAEVAPPDAARWSLATRDELRVPIGVTGANRLQYLALGRNTRQHALIAGKTGSGKSNLFHVLISNLALWCHPDQVEFYLVDFKKGVEFKPYATHRLPHARVVAIESDREFGLSVLQRVDDELRRRGDLFRSLGVQDLPAYHRTPDPQPLPRTLLLIDEFQEFFVEDDRLSQTAALLLDRIVRQGRAFGIHVLLGSQTLGGAYTLSRATLGQMVVRIALQCNETDAHLIMDEENPSPRLLSRPGEAIYNDTAGRLEGNSPFQIVFMQDADRESALAAVRTLAHQHGLDPVSPVIFEGNTPADVRENPALAAALVRQPDAPPAVGRVWLGAPNSIKDPTEARFHRQAGNHLLLVGQRDEAILALSLVALLSLASQFPPADVRFVLLLRTPPHSPTRQRFDQVVACLPQTPLLPHAADIPDVLRSLSDELDRRADPAAPSTAPAIFLLIHELQKFREFRQEDDFSFSLDPAGTEPSPAARLDRLITEGPGHGIHLLVSCDSASNLSRHLSRKAIAEFEMRVLFQMSANDSATLADTPKANALGLHRALFHNGQEGVLETFRPYALPAPDWLAQVRTQLAARAGSQPQPVHGL